jgi:hypothetical protein
MKILSSVTKMAIGIRLGNCGKEVKVRLWF